MTRGRGRRPGVLPTAGLVVEGDAEFLALPRLHTKQLMPGCPPLKAINLGGVGSHVEPLGIAKMVKPKVVQHQVAGRSPVVICLDREQRDVGAAELAREVLAKLRELLAAEHRPTSEIHVVIADRAFEAWLLADARGLHARGTFKRAPRFQCFEGQMGKERKKGVVELGELLGHAYAKTTDGPRVFEQLEFAQARKHGPSEHGSRSLDLFLRALGV